MMLAPAGTLDARHAAVRRHLEAAALDGLIVSHLPNVFYLSNLASTAGILLLTRSAAHLLIDFRYRTAAAALTEGPNRCPGLAVHVAAQSYEEALAGLVASLAPARLGFEAAHLSFARHEWLRRTLDAGGMRALELLPTQGLVEGSRLIKDPGEQATLREAARRLSAVAHGVICEIRAGLMETDVAAQLEAGLRRAGFSRPAFDTIVASGPNSALPHARAGDRRLVSGDLVVLDFGGVYNGYCVDLTRTVSIGPPDPAAVQLYEAVAAAQQAAIGAVAPGVATTAVDAAARNVLTASGYGEAFGHGTGHGLGLEVHEAPRLARPRPEPQRPVSPGYLTEPPTLAPGMVFTIEPGAYLPGFGGVRIEDDVLVTANGCEVLTTVSRELLVR
jgi:Xaa-Pro aminopeptidase